MFRDEDMVIVDELIFDTFSPKEEFVTGDVREVDNEKKTILDKIYEQ